MENLTKTGNVITWRNNNHIFKGVTKVDNRNFELSIDNQNVNFILNDTKLNNIIYQSVDEIIGALTAI